MGVVLVIEAKSQLIVKLVNLFSNNDLGAFQDITVTVEIASDPHRTFSRITYQKANNGDYDAFRDLIEFNEKLIGFSAGDGKR